MSPATVVVDVVVDLVDVVAVLVPLAMFVAASVVDQLSLALAVLLVAATAVAASEVATAVVWAVPLLPAMVADQDTAEDTVVEEAEATATLLAQVVAPGGRVHLDYTSDGIFGHQQHT